MKTRGTRGQRASARALDRAVRRHWRDWHELTLAARRSPGSRRLVHRYRIASRRLLAVEGLLSATPAATPIRDRLDAAFRAAGRIRDLQICRRELAGLDVRRDAVRAVARAARKRLPVLVQRLEHELRTLKPREVRQSVRDLRARLHATEASAATRRQRARVLATALLRQREARRQLDRFARGLGADTDDAALHSLRLRLKGVRYMAELLDSLAGRKSASGQPFDAWQRDLGAVTDLRAVLREVDRCRLRRGSPDEDLAALRQHLLRAEHRRIRALFTPARPAGSGPRQLRLLRAAPLIT